MKLSTKSVIVTLAATAIAVTQMALFNRPNTAKIDSEASAALNRLYSQNPSVAQLGAKAKGILIFPDVLKAGFVFGAHRGNGVLRVNGKDAGYYNTTAGSFGLQAGAQKFSYIIFIMTDQAMSRLHSSGGWEIGTDPNVVLVDAGMAQQITTTTTPKGVYAFVLDQRGLMGGISLQGAKISEIFP
jgi:lipid-binding SYLF domain-containing protein